MRRFQPGEGPSRGLLRDCTTSPINRFAALLKIVIQPHTTELLTAVVCYLKADSRQHFMREDHLVPKMWRLMGMTQRATNHLLHSQTISVEINLK